MLRVETVLFNSSFLSFSVLNSPPSPTELCVGWYGHLAMSCTSWLGVCWICPCCFHDAVLHRVHKYGAENYFMFSSRCCAIQCTSLERSNLGASTTGHSHGWHRWHSISGWPKNEEICNKIACTSPPSYNEERKKLPFLRLNGNASNKNFQKNFTTGQTSEVDVAQKDSMYRSKSQLSRQTTSSVSTQHGLKINEADLSNTEVKLSSFICCQKRKWRECCELIVQARPDLCHPLLHSRFQVKVWEVTHIPGNVTPPHRHITPTEVFPLWICHSPLSCFIRCQL